MRYKQLEAFLILSKINRKSVNKMPWKLHKLW